MEEILSKYFSGNASEEEIKEVETWRGATEANAKAFLDYKIVWVQTAPQRPVNQEMLSDILSENSSDNEIRILPLWKQKSFQLAASLLIALGVIFMIVQLSKVDQPFGQVVAEVTSFDLPDGSTVTIQRGSSLTLEEFGENREVTLMGKGFFEIEEDASAPFIVHTEKANVRVLGTSFLVEELTEKEGTCVMVSTGKVALQQNATIFGRQSMEINLKKGEMGMVAVGQRGISKQKISDTNYLAWKTRKMVFRSTPLHEVSRVFEEVYGISLAFDNSALKDCKLTAKFDNKTPEAVVSVISETFAMDYTKGAQGYVLSGLGCR
ncbi:FecR family protein [Marinoscillum furvescens]|uniref:FecR family protein n=1 Tax=Marinoscillum furvescens DSM 4134 TaxID=1122208 RepID=A0A3D9KZN9_MARFU|nr:FecR domain-containing protein [Marinoscillum furvescens]RED93891.1 FecR family protein [Marinoscillum furvescens DSM 4134]